MNIGAKTGLKALTKLPNDTPRNDEDEDEQELDGDDSDSPLGLSASRISSMVNEYFTSPDDNEALRADPDYAAALDADPIVLGRRISKFVRVSGQRRDAFLKVIDDGNAAGLFNLSKNMLLLDVITRWSATYLMICRIIEQAEVRRSHTMLY